MTTATNNLSELDAFIARHGENACVNYVGEIWGSEGGKWTLSELRNALAEGSMNSDGCSVRGDRFVDQAGNTLLELV